MSPAVDDVVLWFIYSLTDAIVRQVLTRVNAVWHNALYATDLQHKYGNANCRKSLPRPGLGAMGEIVCGLMQQLHKPAVATPR